MDDAICISNWFKLGGFKAQEYLSPATFRFLATLLGVLASSSFEPNKYQKLNGEKTSRDEITNARKDQRLLIGPNQSLTKLLLANITISSINASFFMNSTLNFVKYSFQKGPAVTVRHKIRDEIEIGLPTVGFGWSMEIGRATGSPVQK